MSHNSSNNDTNKETIETFKTQHTNLKEETKMLMQVGKTVGTTIEQKYWDEELKKINEAVHQLFNNLSTYVKVEKEVLFPILNEHLGNENTMTEMLEYDQEQALLQLEKFMALYEKKNSPIDINITRYIMGHVNEACMYLSSYFDKEGYILIPNVEKMFTDEEKLTIEHAFSNETFGK